MNKQVVVFKPEASKYEAIKKDFKCDGETEYPIITLDDIKDNDLVESMLVVISSSMNAYALRDNNGLLKTLLHEFEGVIYIVKNKEGGLLNE